jgi:hypothetical protein
MAQAVSRRPLTVEFGLVPGLVHVGFVVGRVALGQVYLRFLRFVPVNTISPWLSIFINHLEDKEKAICGHSSETYIITST